MEVTTWSGSNNTGGISTDAYEYLQTGHEIKPDGDNPVTRAEYIAVDDDRLDDVLAAIQAAQSACEGQITSISGRVTTAESSISGLDTRVTALEESGGGGGSGGTTNYNELTNIPTINGVTVKGNLSAANLGLANAVDIPTVPTNVSAFTNDAGYLTQEQYTGTVTSVAVKMNGATKGTVTTSGTIDLGTVITSHQSLANYVTTSDSRLTDSRNAKDVYSWAKASTKPTYAYTEITGTPTIPTKASDINALSSTENSFSKTINGMTIQFVKVGRMAMVTCGSGTNNKAAAEYTEWWKYTDSEFIPATNVYTITSLGGVISLYPTSTGFTCNVNKTAISTGAIRFSFTFITKT